MKKFAIIVSEFHSEITEKMLEESLKGFKEQNIKPLVLKVPGALEIPFAAQELILKKKISSIVALGLVLKGDTDHYDRVCEMCSDGIMQISLKYRVPIIFEVLMCSKKSHAVKRIHKAYEASFLATKMLKIL